MAPMSKSGSCLERASSSCLCHDTRTAGSELSQGSSAALMVASSDRLFTTSGEGANVNGGAKDEYPCYNCELCKGDITAFVIGELRGMG